MSRVISAAIKLENGAIIVLSQTDRHYDLIRFHKHSELSPYKMIEQGFMIELSGIMTAGQLAFSNRKYAYEVTNPPQI
jgi:hypothetical protein